MPVGPYLRGGGRMSNTVGGALLSRQTSKGRFGLESKAIDRRGSQLFMTCAGSGVSEELAGNNSNHVPRKRSGNV